MSESPKAQRVFVCVVSLVDVAGEQGVLWNGELLRLPSLRHLKKTNSVIYWKGKGPWGRRKGKNNLEKKMR